MALFQTAEQKNGEAREFFKIKPPSEEDFEVTLLLSIFHPPHS